MIHRGGVDAAVLLAVTTTKGRTLIRGAPSAPPSTSPSAAGGTSGSSIHNHFLFKVCVLRCIVLPFILGRQTRTSGVVTGLVRLCTGHV
jgi:hypothetical protein